MQYRKLGRTDFLVSEVGLGCEHLEGMAVEAVDKVVKRALEQGVNILDVFMAEPNVRSHIGQALQGHRDKVILQGHIGAAWLGGQYSRTRDLQTTQDFVEDFLERYRTDYIDVGMIHFVDSAEDYEAVFNSELIDYVVGLKEKGVFRSIGLSSHQPDIALKAVETGLIDVLMFSLNPAFDLLPSSVTLEEQFTEKPFKTLNLNGVAPARQRLYEACAMNGVGITVMKALAGGTLLNEQLSPLGTALSPVQCMHYSLTRPAVASALIGCRTPDEVDQALAYTTSSASQRDFSEVLSRIPAYSNKGRCMYCNHCLPCPVNIDIAAVMKYFDLAEAALTRSDQPANPAIIPATVRDHYRNLEHRADQCIACGQCEPRCPFAVPVIERMQRAQRLFA